jgi:hypothetical protein
MSNWPELSIVTSTSERHTSHPLIPGVQDGFLERVDELMVSILRGVAYNEHSAAEMDTFYPSSHLHIDVIIHCSCKSLFTYHSLHVIKLWYYPIPRQEKPTNAVIPQVRYR